MQSFREGGTLQVSCCIVVVLVEVVDVFPLCVVLLGLLAIVIKLRENRVVKFIMIPYDIETLSRASYRETL